MKRSEKSMRMAAMEPAKAHRRTSSAPPMRTAAMMSSSAFMGVRYGMGAGVSIGGATTC